MAQLARHIDSEQVVDDGDDFERFVAPAGDYMMVPVESVQKEDDDGNVGWRIKWEMLEGEFEGRKLTQFIDIVHSDPEREKRSEKTYKRLETGLGFKIEDDQDVLDKTMMVRLGYQAPTSKYPARNYFNHFWQVGTEPPADTQTRGVSQPQQRAASNAPAPRQPPAGGGRPTPSAPPTRASNPPPRNPAPRTNAGGKPWPERQ